MNDFCEYCGVAKELHPDSKRDDEENCDIALRKAKMLNRFAELFQ
jgi:hypothetical protein